MPDGISSWVAANDALIALVILFAMVISFALERVPPVTTAVVAAAACFAFGLIPQEEALLPFSNSAPISIAALFMLTAALQRTGVLDRMAHMVITAAARGSWVSLLLMTVMVLLASAFINNTAVVLVLIPVVIALCETLKISKRRMLIPLSYLSIMGGTLTLIGTSTNLIVAGVAARAGLEPFTIFEITGVGLAVIGAGIPVLMVLGYFLLPKGGDPDRKAEKPLLFLTDLSLPATAEAGVALPRSAMLIAHTRTGKPAGTEPAATENKDGPELIAPGERVSVRLTLPELLTVIEQGKFSSGVARRSPAESEATIRVQAILSPNDPNIGRRADQLSYLSVRPVRLRGIARHGNQPGPELASTRLRIGDHLLLEGTERAIDALTATSPLIITRDLPEKPFRRDSAGFAIAIIAAVIAAAASGTVSLPMAGIIGLGAMLVLGCLSMEDAWRALDPSVLGLIVAMLIVGSALQSTGAVDLIVNAAVPLFMQMSPFWALVAIYALTSLLTEIVTNAAVAVVVTPIVISLAALIGIDPRALVVAVMFGASASFASPVGYQTNTLVYAAGNYRFSDFLKIGVAMNTIIGFVSCLAISYFYGV
ncbi:MAG: SLC13 family permease [Hyphomonas sp.]|uniref:SLC13 family permease n=1 Tax=Hyphomonas sp. TaxID=87 RepID=UPI0034A03822